MASWRAAASLAIMALALFSTAAAANDEVCSLKPFDSGIGDAAITRWSYDAESGACRTFIWGGGSTGSNGNNFETLEDCLTACNLDCTDDHACDGFPSTPAGQRQEQQCLIQCNNCIDDCGLELPPNDGKAEQIKQECVEECIVPVNEPEACWSYDEDAGFCKLSHDGGCDNSGNKFETLEDCMESGEVTDRCFDPLQFVKCALPTLVSIIAPKCLKQCNKCLDQCDLEFIPSDGKGQLKEECIASCVPELGCVKCVPFSVSPF